PQHIGLGRGGANAKPGISHFCVTTDNFEVDRILQVLAAHGVTKLDPLDANFPARGGALKSRVRIRREDAGGTKEGTPELYFTDPDGIVDQFELDRVLKALADFGVKPRGNSAGPVVPLTSYVSMRMEDRGGAREGTPELYFTDPDGIVVQLQDTRYCGGAGYLGDVCRP